MVWQLGKIVFGCALVAAICYFFAVPPGYTALAILIGWPLLAAFVTSDDDPPGGYGRTSAVTPAWFGPENWGWLALRGAIVALAFALEYSAAGLPIRQPLQWAFGLGVLAAALIYTTVLRCSAGN